jgi:proline racemase/trans-L-3-hydroxyproline dehydratase
MFGAVLISPTDTDGDLAALFMDQGGYLSMCGHASIALGMVATELGLVPPRPDDSPMKLETEAGLVQLQAQARNGTATAVRFRNVPSFFLGDHEVNVPGIGTVPFGVAFGGSFFALVASADLGFRLDEKSLEDSLSVALRILKSAQGEVQPEHPTMGHIGGIKLLQLFEPLHPLDGTFRRWQNLVVWGRGQFDRSPCGSGTSALMAALHSRKMLEVGEPITSHGVTGAPFHGSIVEETVVGDFRAVVPEITGSASIIGLNQWIVDSRDPLGYGFQPSEVGFGGCCGRDQRDAAAPAKPSP